MSPPEEPIGRIETSLNNGFELAGVVRCVSLSCSHRLTCLSVPHAPSPEAGDGAEVSNYLPAVRSPLLASVPAAAHPFPARRRASLTPSPAFTTPFPFFLSLQSKVDGYVFFKPAPAKTPALRSGLINPEQPYNFLLPSGKGWKVRRRPEL